MVWIAPAATAHVGFGAAAPISTPLLGTRSGRTNMPRSSDRVMYAAVECTRLSQLVGRGSGGLGRTNDVTLPWVGDEEGWPRWETNDRDDDDDDDDVRDDAVGSHGTDAATGAASFRSPRDVWPLTHVVAILSQ